MKNKSRAQMTKTQETIEKILKQPYERILIPDTESGTFTARILEFHGCIAEGDTPNEAYANLESVAKSWIDAALNSGQEIPEPSLNIGYSGKFALRLPRSLHRRAAEMAERDDTSLNQFFVSAVAERVGSVDTYSRLTRYLYSGIAQTVNMVATQNFVLTTNYADVQKLLSSFLPPNDIATTPPVLGIPQSLGGK